MKGEFDVDVHSPQGVNHVHKPLEVDFGVIIYRNITGTLKKFSIVSTVFNTGP
jgi:hypothetical protein